MSRPNDVNSTPLNGSTDKPPLTPNTEIRDVAHAGQPAPNALPTSPLKPTKLGPPNFLVVMNLNMIIEIFTPPTMAIAIIKVKANLPETDSIVPIMFKETLGNSEIPETDHA